MTGSRPPARPLPAGPATGVRPGIRTGDWVAEQRRRHLPPPPAPKRRGRQLWERMKAAPEIPVAALVLGAVAVLLVVRAASVRDQVREDLVTSMEESFPFSLNEVDTWADSRRAQAALLARVVGDAPADQAGFAVVRYDEVFRRLDTQGAYVGARVVPAREAPPEAPASPGAIAVNIRPVRIADGVAAEFVAPVRRDGVEVAERYVLMRARLRDTTFRNLDPSRHLTRGGRSMLLARIGDSVHVASARSRSMPSPERRSFAIAELPPQVRRALAGARSSGIGRGLLGTRVVYATHPVLAPGWLLLREQEEAAVLRVVDRAILVEAAALGLLALAVTAAAVGRVRAGRARREQALTELRADFVASASHELRTPLAQIRMFAELLRKGALKGPEDTDRALRVIEKEANRLTILVDNVLNFTRLRKRVSREVPMPARVAEEARQVAHDFEPLAAERGVRVVVEAEEDAVAFVDSLALRQVLLNFLENAVKYGPRNGLVMVRAGRVADRAGDRVQVSVEDEGPGVPPAEREAIWKAFHRRQEAIDSGETGSGIGLAVVRELVLQFGGTTRVEAGAKGARFVAEFPAV